jgi:hypothetical protein
MLAFEKVDQDHVLRAMSEFDRRGADEFLSHHGASGNREYMLIHGHKEYDARAILGVALQYAVGRVAQSEEFSDGGEGAAKVLQGLGFDVEFRGGAATGDVSGDVEDSDLSTEQARAAWATAAREVLSSTAGHYNSVVTRKELSAAVMSTTGIRTRRLMHYWIGDVLGRVSAECDRREEPLLSALCVNAEGSVGEGYAEAVLQARGKRPADADVHAATERLECYRHFGATLPQGGGVATLTPKVQASRDRARKTRQAERVLPICPTCNLAIPPTGVCDNCG